MQKLKGGQILAKDGMIRFTNREDCLEIGPGFGTHSYLAGMFGSEGVDPNCFTLYFTDYTEFDRSIFIECGVENMKKIFFKSRRPGGFRSGAGDGTVRNGNI